MSRPAAEFENPSPFDEGKNLARPILPAVERNRRGDEVVRESELVIEKFKEESQERFHNIKRGFGCAKPSSHCFGETYAAASSPSDFLPLRSDSTADLPRSRASS